MISFANNQTGALFRIVLNSNANFCFIANRKLVGVVGHFKTSKEFTIHHPHEAGAKSAPNEANPERPPAADRG